MSECVSPSMHEAIEDPGPATGGTECLSLQVLEAAKANSSRFSWQFTSMQGRPRSYKIR